MHPDEHPADVDLVTRLVAEQLPAWAGREVVPVVEHGTDHLLFRLGRDDDAPVARMPRVAWAAGQAASDARWLPVLAPHLPVAVPVPLALGEPGLGYPFPWSVVPWLPGSVPGEAEEHDERLGADLARFVTALHAVEAPSDAPRKEPGQRGAPLHHVDDAVRAALAEITELGLLEPDVVEAAATVWEDAVAAPAWVAPPIWIHADLLAGNLVVTPARPAGGRRLTGVIDWGGLGVGDPAPDLRTAWTTFEGVGRAAFRAGLGDRYDDATWRRARGWAVAPALTGLPYYRDSAPAFADGCRASIHAVVATLGA